MSGEIVTLDQFRGARGRDEQLPGPRSRDDQIWAVIATAGRLHRVAEIYPSRDAALADRSWREQQVRAYAQFLRNSRQPVPCYSVAPIRRSDLPRSWAPLPALGFLRGRFT